MSTTFCLRYGSANLGQLTAEGSCAKATDVKRAVQVCQILEREHVKLPVYSLRISRRLHKQIFRKNLKNISNLIFLLFGLDDEIV